MSTDVWPVDTGSMAEREVVATVDGTGGNARFVVADIGRDEAWVSVPEEEARSLDEWR